MAAPPVTGIQPGSLNAQVIHEKVIGELKKVKDLGDQIGNPAIAIKKLPDKQQRKTLEVQAGSVFNIAGKNSELVEISKQLQAAVKAAGKDLAKNTKAVFNAKSEILKAIGEIEVDVASGKYSIDAAFARSKRADKIIRATLQIAESGGLEDKTVALENIQALKELQNVPSVALALAKNATRTVKLEAEASNPMLLPFMSASAAGKFGGNQQGKDKARDFMQNSGLAGQGLRKADKR